MIAYEEKFEPLLIKWWADLGEDRETAFHSSLGGLGNFILYFRQTAALMFEADEQGIWFAASSRPFYDGALWDVWIRSNKRHTRSAIQAIELSYGLALERFPFLLGLTKQPNLHAIHLKLGYEYAGRIKQAIDGADMYAYQLTREGWHGRKIRAIRVRDAKRQTRLAAIEQIETAESNGVVH